MRAAWAASAIVAITMVVVVGCFHRRPAPEPVPGPVPHQAQFTTPAPADFLQSKAPLSPPPAMSVAAWAAQHSSMRGASLDGDWSRLDAQGRLLPALSLRRRFDHLLTLQGELSLEQLQTWVEQAVTAEHGSAQAHEVMVLWLRYLALLRHPFQSRVDTAQPHNWAVVLAEREGVRQRALGLPWAEAFYGQEHLAMRQAAEASLSASAPTMNAAGMDVSALDAPARERLAAEQAAWSDWERRLSLAKQEWQRLVAAPELSQLQREAAFERWLPTQFSASEQKRVRVLLK